MRISKHPVLVLHCETFNLFLTTIYDVAENMMMDGLDIK
jgi:hypothetical protein